MPSRTSATSTEKWWAVNGTCRLAPNSESYGTTPVCSLMNSTSLVPPTRPAAGTFVGEGAYINFNVTILDSAEVHIGDRALIGPNCQLITVGHPVDDVQRRRDAWEQAAPLHIGEDAWLGAGVTVLPGVTIGARSVIGAGSVVTRSIPDDAVAVGNPAKVIRDISKH